MRMFARRSPRWSAPRRADIRAWMAERSKRRPNSTITDALAWFGLRMTPPPATPRACLGVATRTENGKTIVTGIRRGSPAAIAGMSLLDEIESMNGEPMPAGQLSQRLERLSPGSKVPLAITRRDEPRNVDVDLATDPGHGWQLTASPGANRAQSEQLDAWLAP